MNVRALPVPVQSITPHHPACPAWCARHADGTGHVRHGDHYRVHTSAVTEVPLPDPDQPGRVVDTIELELQRVDVDGQVGEVVIYTALRDMGNTARSTELLDTALTVGGARDLANTLTVLVSTAGDPSAASEGLFNEINGRRAGGR
jgi:hypothetical protein